MIAVAPMSQTQTQTSLDADAFWELLGLPENADKRLELVEGVVIEMPGGSGGRHGETGIVLARQLSNHVYDNNLGRMTGAETCYRLYKNPNGKDTVRCPDIGFVTIERAPQPLPPEYVPYAPDLAVEIISPNDKADDVQRKVLDYLNYGVRLVWVIYPDTRTIVVHTPAGSRMLGQDDMLDGGDVLPGFSLLVRNIFPS